MFRLCSLWMKTVCSVFFNLVTTIYTIFIFCNNVIFMNVIFLQSLKIVTRIVINDQIKRSYSLLRYQYFNSTEYARDIIVTLRHIHACIECQWQTRKKYASVNKLQNTTVLFTSQWKTGNICFSFTSLLLSYNSRAMKY